MKTLYSFLNSKCKGPQAGVRDSKEATVAGVQRARERKWWQKVGSCWTWTLIFEGEPTDRLGGCLLICDSSLPQQFFLPTRARFTGLNRTTRQEHRWWPSLQKACTKEQGGVRGGLPFPRTAKNGGMGGKCAYKVWNDQEGFPEKLRGGGGGLQGADLAELPCNAHRLNFQNTSIAFCLCRVLYFVHKRCHAIVPAPWVVRAGIIWRDNPGPVRRGDDIYEEAGSLMIQS